MRRKFKWECWDFDLGGSAFVIAKEECPCREDVPGYIVKEDKLDPEVLNPAMGEHLSADDVQEGWCKYMVRSDWDNVEGPYGGYFVEIASHDKSAYKGKPGWFPVWIVRIGEWY